MSPILYFRLTFADGHQCSVSAESVHFALWAADEDTKVHGVVVSVA